MLLDLSQANNVWGHFSCPFLKKKSMWPGSIILTLQLSTHKFIVATALQLVVIDEYGFRTSSWKIRLALLFVKQGFFLMAKELVFNFK